MKNGILYTLAMTCCICNVACGQAIIEKLPPLGTTTRFEYTKIDPTVKEPVRGEMIISRTDKSADSDLPCIEVTFNYPEVSSTYRLTLREKDERLTLAILERYEANHLASVELYKRIGKPLPLENIPSGSEEFRSFESYMLGKTDSAVARKNTQASLLDSSDATFASSTTAIVVNGDEATPFGAGHLLARRFLSPGKVLDVTIDLIANVAEQ